MTIQESKGRKVRRSLPALALAGLLSACATAPGPLAPELSARYTKVAVVSVAARDFSRTYVGLTVFGNEYEKEDISSWHVDAAYEDQIAQALTRTGRRQLVKVPNAQAADFLPANGLQVNDKGWDALAAPAKALCAAGSLDGVILVSSLRSGDFIAGTNQSMTGAGVFVRGPVGKPYAMHLIAQMSVLDCRTGLPVVQQAVREAARNGSGSLGRVPSEELDRRSAKLPMPRWSEALRKTMREQLVLLPTFSWAPTLKRLFGEV